MSQSGQTSTATSAGSGKQSGGNVYDQSTAALGESATAMGQAQDLYNSGGLQGNAATYDPTQIDASQAADPNSIASGIGDYMNPYTQSVIDNAAADINRQTNMSLDSIGANASMSGAFGGARHGLMEGMAVAEGAKNMGDLSATLRNDAYGQAANLSAQDIANGMGNNQFNANLSQNANLANQGSADSAGAFNANSTNAWGQAQNADEIARAGGLMNVGAGFQGLGETGFGMGQAINQDMLSQGSLQQQLAQNLMNLANGQYQGLQQNPNNMLNILLNASGMSPLNNAGTTTNVSTPGLLDYASVGAQAYGGGKS